MMTTYKYSRLNTNEEQEIGLPSSSIPRLHSDHDIRQRSASTGSYDLSKFRENLRRKLNIGTKNDQSMNGLPLANGRLHTATHKQRGNGDTDSSDSDVSDPDVVTVKKKWTRYQWLLIVILSFSSFVSTVAYSLLSPFFPSEAEKKELPSAVTGMIFGFYEFVVFLSSPFLGKMISKVSPAKMLVIGGLLSSASSFVFGFLEWMPNGSPFAMSCFVVRLFEGLGSSAIMVSSYTLVPLEYPGEISSVNSYLEAVVGLGFMAGPPVGAFLYQWGGFRLPFMVVGVIFFVCSLASYCILPESEPIKPQSSDYFGLLKIPGIIIVYIELMTAGIAITYLDPTLAPYLEKSHQLSISAIGGIFFLWSLSYTITSPIAGKLGDRGYIWSLMIIGNIVTGVAYLLLGPSSLLSWMVTDEGPLWLVIVSLLIMGVGCSGMMILPYQAFLELALVNGYEDSVDTYGLISGLTASASSMGSFIGPILAGYIYDRLKFHWSTTFCAFFSILPAVILGGYVYLMKRKGLPYQYDWDNHTTAEDKKASLSKKLSSQDLNNNSDHEDFIPT